MLVVLIRHARECRGGLSLATGRDDRQFLVRDLAQLSRVHHDPFRHFQVAQIDRHADVVLHAASRDEDAAAGGLGAVDHLLDAGDKGGEGGDDDAPLGSRHNLMERFADDLLRWSVARDLRVRRVGEEEEHALVAAAGQSGKIRAIPHHGRMVELEVASVDDEADRRPDDQSGGVGDAVGDVVRLHLERPLLGRFAGLQDANVGLLV